MGRGAWCAAAALALVQQAGAWATIPSEGSACPSGYRPPADEYECRAALAEVGIRYSELDSDQPSATSDAVCPTPVCVGELPIGGTVFAGDSDIDYWSTNGFADSMNIGYGGYVCSDVLSEVDGWLLTLQPATVVLVCGENDLCAGDRPDAAFAKYKAIVEKLTSADVRVIYMGTKKEPATKNLHDEYAEYDGLIRDYAASLAPASSGDAPLTMVDVSPGFDAVGNPNSLYQSDELHLSGDGYALWTEWAGDALSDPTCVRWESGDCAGPGAGGGASDDGDDTGAADDASDDDADSSALESGASVAVALASVLLSLVLA